MNSCHIQMDTKTCKRCGAVKARSEFSSKQANCKSCAVIKSTEWVAANREERRVYQAAYREAHSEQLKAYGKAWKLENPDAVSDWRAENPERCREHHDKWVRENPEAFFISQHKSGRKYRQANPDKECAKVQRRNASKLKATPAWADYGLIDATYTMATAMTRLTGVKYNVDHIVPLKSRLVCGLHVGCNLQLLTAAENNFKGNHYWPDMP